MASEPTELQIEAAMDDLSFFEAWCDRNDVALSALGRTALQDQAVLYRWRSLGIKGASFEKRRALAIYVLRHPDGIPGYVRAKTGRRRGARSQAFVPNRSPTGSRAGQITDGSGSSTKVPVPSPNLLEMDDLEYVRKKAFARGVAIAVVLAEMVSIGIQCAKEAEYEEQQNAKD